MTLHKEEIDIVEGYPALVLEELQIYSVALSRLFNIKEFHIQVLNSLRQYVSANLVEV